MHGCPLKDPATGEQIGWAMLPMSQQEFVDWQAFQQWETEERKRLAEEQT